MAPQALLITGINNRTLWYLIFRHGDHKQSYLLPILKFAPNISAISYIFPAVSDKKTDFLSDYWYCSFSMPPVSDSVCVLLSPCMKNNTFTEFAFVPHWLRD